MKLSKNFSLREFTKSDIALRLNIDNDPPWEVVKNLKLLCEKVLQPLRDYYGKPIIVTSGYRSVLLNKKVGGSRSSDHCRGCAVDIEDANGKNGELYRAILALNLEYKQLIYEYGDEINPDWLHISFDAQNNICQRLKAIKVRKRTIYIDVLSK